jgi:outer membrane receptor protein involved in Fe transport
MPTKNLLQSIVFSSTLRRFIKHGDKMNLSGKSSSASRVAFFGPQRVVLTPLAIAIGFAFAQVSFAQQTPSPASAEAASDDTLQLDRVVVTGTSTARSKLKQSVSTSTISAEQLQNSKAASSAEVLRAIPGLRAEASGGEGNANLGVRGLPMSDGGGRYVQLQEDGLPVLLIGDMSFATADQFVRTGYWNDSIEVIRGGSASTLSTNSPGAIVNFIGKTGRDAGGAVGLSFGLGNRQFRTDFEQGGSLGKDTGMYYHIGGFYRQGQGPRNTNVNVENGGMIRASLTKEFGKDGYLRATFKHLSDSTPTYLPVPVKANGSKIEEFPTIDPRRAFFVSSNFATDTTFDRSGNKQVLNPQDGLTVKTTSVGFEGKANLGDGFSITNKFRTSQINGSFIGVFPAGGQPTTYTGKTPVFSVHLFNTDLDNFNNTFNDLRLSKEFSLGGSNKVTVLGGLFTGTQHVGETWHWNRYNFELTGSNARVLDNAGNVTISPVAQAFATWGGCCFRSIDVTVNAFAPYLAATFDMGPISVDASVRSDNHRGSGSVRVLGDDKGQFAEPKGNTVSYKTKANSYSLGGNYEIDRNIAAFARLSSGASWKSPDRVVYFDSPSTIGSTVPYPINKIEQAEVGLKARSGGLSGFLTLFSAKTKEGAGYELTTQTVKNNSYKATGLEAEVGARFGSFRVQGGATFTSAKLTSGENSGKTPRRQAKLVYQVSPSYAVGDFEVGGSLIGTTKSFAQDDNIVELPGYSTVNLFANYAVTKNLTVSAGVNNLFNTLGYTEAEGQNNLGNNPLYIARAINGRTATIGLKISF